ncbi:hypothetical protein KYK29_04380 [Shinella daejeonensis]|uniref:ABC transporter substrate-binding protein n=1 Tax=Shinella daejeonensis TaxID=659017 RepID=UPI0020C7E5E2|nr:glycine betaine ABC transporter substrate-binding protein [Shinella daejeonensis]MCP8894157.1 hypothetical protein [Shinella daejeonensis]
MKHSTFLALAAAAALTATSAHAQEKIAIGDLTWTGAKAIGSVIKAVIEGPLKSEAEIVSGLSDGSLVAAGMDKGDGSADVYPDLWMPNRQGIWDSYIDGAETVAHNEPYPGTQRMYVPSYLADKVKSIEDLRDPNIAALFDKDGNGKGEYWAGDAGWASTKMWQVKFKSYGLSELWEAEVVPDATFKSQLKAAIANERPILFYYWTPEWIHAAYELSALSEPERTDGCEAMALDKEDWLEASKFSCVSSDALIYVAYSKSLEQRNPPVARFLSQMRLDPATVNEWILLIDRDGKHPADVAEDWVAANPDVVNGWIK